MFIRSLLHDRDVEPIGDAVLALLDKVGALYQNDEILTALAAAGARVDHQRQTATFPKEMTREFLDSIRQDAPTDAERGHHTFAAPGHGGLGHLLSQYYYDTAKRERRIGNQTDYIRMLKFGDALYRDSGVGQCLLLADVPAPVEPLESTLIQFRHVHRPRGAYVQDLRQVDYLIELEEISGVSDLVWLANVGFSSPLRLGKDIADRFVYGLKHGRPANLYVMTAGGAGTPVTVAGTIVNCAAEFVANWMAGRAIQPDCDLTAGVLMSTMDMHSGETSYSAVDAMVRNFATREFVRRWTGITIGVCGPSYNAAKAPGLYATLEKAYVAMTAAAFTGSHPGVVSGHLDGGLAICPEQFVLDIELAETLEHLAGAVEVTDETIGLGAMLEVGHAETTNFLECEHTARHFRSALWLPKLLERTGWTGPECEDRVLQRACEKVDQLVAAYQPPEVDEDKLTKMRAVVDRALKALA